MRSSFLPGPRTGFTLVELTVSLAILTIMGAGLVALLAQSTTVWRRSQAITDRAAVASWILDRLAADLAAVSPVPPAGGASVLAWRQRSSGARVLVMVRRLPPESTDAATRMAGNFLLPLHLIDGVDDRAQAAAGSLYASGGLSEVVWMLDAGGVLRRGRRSPVVDGSWSTAPPDPDADPEPGLSAVGRGVLYLDVRPADPRLPAPPDGAWRVVGPAGRPDLRTPGPLPPAVAVELELDARVAGDATVRLLDPAAATSGRLRVEGGPSLPTGAFWVRIESEWLHVQGSGGPGLDVLQRGGRGTEAVDHAPGTTLAWGEPWSVVLPLPCFGEDLEK